MRALLRSGHVATGLAAAALLASCNQPAPDNSGAALKTRTASSQGVVRACYTVTSGDARDSLAVGRRLVQSFVEDSKRRVAGVRGSKTAESIRFLPDSSYEHHLSSRGVTVEGVAEQPIVMPLSEVQLELKNRSGELYVALSLVSSRLASETAEEASYSVRLKGTEVVLELQDAFVLTFECEAQSIHLRRIKDLIGRKE